MNDQQHPQLQGNKDDHSRKAGESCEFDPRNVGERHCHQTQQRRKHTEIGVGFAVSRKTLEIDRTGVDRELAVEQVHQHAVERPDPTSPVQIA